MIEITMRVRELKGDKGRTPVAVEIGTARDGATHFEEVHAAMLVRAAMDGMQAFARETRADYVLESPVAGQDNAGGLAS